MSTFLNEAKKSYTSENQSTHTYVTDSTSTGNHNQQLESSTANQMLKCTSTQNTPPSKMLTTDNQNYRNNMDYQPMDRSAGLTWSDYEDFTDDE